MKQVYVVISETTNGGTVELVTVNEQLAERRRRDLIVERGTEVQPGEIPAGNLEDFDVEGIDGKLYWLHDSYDNKIARVEVHEVVE